MIGFLKKHYHLKYHGVYQHAKKLFAFDLILLFTAIVMFGASIFFFLWKPGLTDLIDLSVSIGQERIRSGEPVSMTVNFTNRSKQTLKEVSLGIKLPGGFIVNREKTPLEIFSDSSIFSKVKEIAPGASGHVELSGQLWLEPKKEERIIANLSYRPDNKSNREQKLSSLLANLSDSVLTSDLEFPSSTLANSIIKFSYTLTNTSNQIIEHINITNSWDKKIFTDTDSSNISLAAGASKKIEGTITSPSKSGEYIFSITPEVLINNRLIPQSPSNQKFTVLTPDVISSVKLSQPISYGEPGQVIPIELRWESRSNFALQNLSLHLTSNIAGVVDWKKTALENHAPAENNGIFFDGNSRTSLSSGSAHNPDTFTVNIYLLKTFNTASIEKPVLEIYPVIKAGSAKIPEQQFSQRGSGAGFPLATELKFTNIEARYYTPEGDQLGRGPLPPQVGKTTKYWIFVKLSNSSNIINDVVFKTSLPAGIEFTGKQSTTIGPQLKYNASDRSVSWQYYTLPANSQTGLYFEVAVTPDSSQIGQNIRLTNGMSLSATDEFVGKKFNLAYPAISNTLNRNDGGSEMGSKVTP